MLYQLVTRRYYDKKKLNLIKIMTLKISGFDWFSLENCWLYQLEQINLINKSMTTVTASFGHWIFILSCFASNKLPLKPDELLNPCTETLTSVCPPPFVGGTFHNSLHLENCTNFENSLSLSGMCTHWYSSFWAGRRQLRSGPVLISWCNWYHKSTVINQRELRKEGVEHVAI